MGKNTTAARQHDVPDKDSGLTALPQAGELLFAHQPLAQDSGWRVLTGSS